MHEGLTRRRLSPGEHLVGSGYTSAAIVLAAQARGIDLVGPLPPASDRQTREGKGFALADFTIHWDQRYAVCPRGATSRYWGHTRMDGHPRTVVIFPEWDCRNCKVRPACTTSFIRRLTLHPREEHKFLQRQRTEQETDAWKQKYANATASKERSRRRSARPPFAAAATVAWPRQASPTSSALPPSTCIAWTPTRPALRLDPRPRPCPLRDRIAIAAYVGRSDILDRALARFAVAYADQNERDHAAMLDAIRAGRLTARTEL